MKYLSIKSGYDDIFATKTSDLVCLTVTDVTDIVASVAQIMLDKNQCLELGEWLINQAQ